MSAIEKEFSDEFNTEDKAEFNRILTDLKENPLSIHVEKTEFLYHPSDYVDSRVGIAFIGEFAFFAGLFTEFWSNTSIAPYVFTNLTTEQQTTFQSVVNTYQAKLQTDEVEEYKAKLSASPTNIDLTDEEVDDKIQNIVETGDKKRLPMNSKEPSSNDFTKISYDSLTAETFITKLAESDPDGKVKLIVFVHSDDSQQKIQFAHPSIPTICPKLEIANTGSWTDEQLQIFSEFIRSLPDVLQILM